DVPATLPLFESLFVFENYPVRAPDLAEATERGLAVRQVEAPVRTRYRLTLVAVPGEELSLYVVHDGARFPPDAAGRALEHVRSLLEQIAAAPPGAPVAGLCAATASERGERRARSPGLEVLDLEGQPAPTGTIGVVRAAAGDDPGARGRYLPDGSIERLGREGDRVTLGGVDFFPEEVALALRRDPSVADAHVAWRPGGAGLVAYVAPAAAGAPPTLEGLRASLAARLPEAMLPRALVRLEALPRDAAGAVDEARLPEPEGAAEAPAFEPPRTVTEKLLADIWGELVGRAVGIADDFFALGGQSLIAMQVLSRVRHTFGVNLSVRALFEGRTVAAVARAVDELRAERPSFDAPSESRAVPDGRGAGALVRTPLERLPAREAYDLSPYQLPELYFSQLAPDSPMYN
ncbi:MAG TPA: phosphopantetheine-binding protein, partial [Polyangiaceae bacterium]|nr:phosphopantetheine-binding protein [Polyangiaceae bacterium]